MKITSARYFVKRDNNSVGTAKFRPASGKFDVFAMPLFSSMQGRTKAYPSGIATGGASRKSFGLNSSGMASGRAFEAIFATALPLAAALRAGVRALGLLGAISCFPRDY